MRKSCIHLENPETLLTSQLSLVAPSSRYVEELQLLTNELRCNHQDVVWERPDIVSYDRWLADAYRRLGDGHPDLASRSLIPSSTLLLIAQQRSPNEEVDMHANAVCEAWQLVWDWNLWQDWEDAQTTDNGQVCATWFQRIQRYLKRESLITSAELPSVLLEAIERRDWQPAKSNWIRTDSEPHSKRNLFAALARLDLCQEMSFAKVRQETRLEQAYFDTPRQELATMAMWAREKLAYLGETCTVGIAIDGQAASYETLKRQFESTFPEVSDINELVSISQGQPFVQTRLYQDFINLLHWTCYAVPYEVLIELARSPYFPKLGLFTEIQKFFKERISLREYSRELKGPQGQPLAYLAKNCTSRPRTPRPFTEAVSRLMQIIQTSGYSYREIPTFSYVDQDHVEVFARLLDQVSSVGSMFPQISWRAFVNLVEIFAKEQTVFTGTAEAPIQLLSRTNTRYMHFDALWVAGMSDLEWPSSPNPNPFIPMTMQKKAQLPRVTRPQMLEEAKRLTSWWGQCSREVIFSYSDEDEEANANSSELVDELLHLVEPRTSEEQSDLVENPELVQFTHPWSAPDPYGLDYGSELLQPNANRIDDLTKYIPRTALVQNSVKCQFRAWAIHRAGLEEPPSVQSFLPEAKDRGSIFHYVMEKLITVGTTQDDILNLNDDEVDEAIEVALAKYQRNVKLKLPEHFMKHEKLRLKRSVAMLQEVEAKRAPFIVREIEKEVPIHIQGLKFRGFIDRIDSTDTLSHAILDYKTGRNYTTAQWLPERLQDPQLPMYVLGQPDADGLGFITIHRDKQSIEGTSESAFGDEKEFGFCSKTFEEYPDFETLKNAWTTKINQAISNHLEGNAEVNPIDERVCEYCHLKHHCRIFDTSVRSLTSSEIDGEES